MKSLEDFRAAGGKFVVRAIIAKVSFDDVRVAIRFPTPPKVVLFKVSCGKPFLLSGKFHRGRVSLSTFRTSWRGFRWKVEQLAWAWLHRSGRHCSEIGAERLVKDAYKSSRASTLNAIDTLNFPIRWQQMFLFPFECRDGFFDYFLSFFYIGNKLSWPYIHVYIYILELWLIFRWREKFL